MDLWFNPSHQSKLYLIMWKDYIPSIIAAVAAGVGTIGGIVSSIYLARIKSKQDTKQVDVNSSDGLRDDLFELNNALESKLDKRDQRIETMQAEKIKLQEEKLQLQVDKITLENKLAAMEFNRVQLEAKIADLMKIKDVAEHVKKRVILASDVSHTPVKKEDYP